MHRLLALVIGCGACTGPHLRSQTLPELVTAPRAAPAPVLALVLAPGERMIWDVSAHGMSIGRAELLVGPRDVRSSFATTGLASALASAHHELATELDRDAARPTAMTEVLVLDGETRRTEALLGPDGYEIGGVAHALPEHQHAHTMHSALGWLRAWARPGATASYLYVLHLDKLYRLDAAPPVVEDVQGTKTLRVDCEVRAPDRSDPVPFAVWLTADAARIPLKVVFDTKAGHITADLI